MITPTRPSDFRLLQRYALEADHAAFEELVQRHSGMTVGVCRRVLGAGGDADDAAQSAFLSLAKNAPLLVEQLGTSGSVAGWLYRVAVNSALQQRRATKARIRREMTVVQERETSLGNVSSIVEQAELLVVLDEELRELPARYRTPLVLCHLEGKTQHEAADELGLSYGTLRRRLDQGRQLLKARIGRRGVMASSALMLTFWKSATAEASTVPSDFVDSVTSALHGQSATTIPQPVALVRPRVSSPGRVPGPNTTAASSLPASVYSALLAGLLLVMAIPPVVSAVTSDGNSRSSAQTDSPSTQLPSSPNDSLSRSSV